MTRATSGFGSGWVRACGVLLLLALGFAAPADGLVVGGPSPKPFGLGPQVPCPPGTHIAFTRPDPLAPTIWIGTAYNPKTGKMATSGMFNSDIQGTDWVLNEIIGMCDELQSGVSTVMARQRITGAVEPSHVVVGDFDGDGRPDLAVANQGSNNVSVALGLPSGLFGSTITFPTGVAPLRIVAGDFNNDGKLDL